MPLFLLALLLVVLLACYFMLKIFNEKQEKDAETENSEESIEMVQIPADEIAGLSVKWNGESLSFTKKDGSWYYDKDEGFPVNQDSMNNLVSKFEKVTAVRDLGKPEDISEYGLEDPAQTITVTRSDGTKAAFYIGNQNVLTSDYYVYVDSPEKVYTTDSSIITGCQFKLYDMAETSIFPIIPSDAVTQVKVEQEGSSFTLKSDEGTADEDAGKTWTVQGMGEQAVKADSTAASTLISGVGSLLYNGYLDYNAEDLTVYGLDKPTAVITIDYTEEAAEETEEPQTEAAESQAETGKAEEGTAGSQTETSEPQEEQTETARISRQTVLLVGGQDADGNYYVKLSDSNEVHTMSETALSSWLGAEAEDFKAETPEESETQKGSELEEESETQKGSELEEEPETQKGSELGEESKAQKGSELEEDSEA